MSAVVQDRTEVMLRYPVRTHPYAGVSHDSEGRYYDFKTRPDLITKVLEDFKPHAGRCSVQHFYRLLQYINRPDGSFETTDCGLTKRLYQLPSSPFPEKSGCLGGRLMLIFRDLDQNCSKKHVIKLVRKMQRQLLNFGRDASYVGFVVGPFPTLFLETQKRGFQTDIEFAMWGDSFEDAMARFDEVVGLMERTIVECDKRGL
ncbi:MAG: hypothetical protein CMH69_19455 [Nitratireductor sp.]|nr:hypothetical protein [Nitratireductor sp.]